LEGPWRRLNGLPGASPSLDDKNALAVVLVVLVDAFSLAFRLPTLFVHCHDLARFSSW